MVVEHWECTNEEYHASDGVSNSKLGTYIANPWMYNEQHVLKTYKEPPKDCYRVGSGLHEKILEEFKGNIVVPPKNVLAKNGAKSGNAYKDWAEENKTKLILSQKEYDEVKRMAAAVYRNTRARSIIESGQREHSIRWTDDETGLLLRCRFDCFHSKINADIKTTTDASAQAFSKSAFNCNYHLQDAFYSEGSARYRKGEVVPFVFIAVDQWKCNCWELDEEFRERGRQMFREQLSKLKHSLDNNEWCDPNPQIKSISMPNWAYSQEQWKD